MSKGRRKSKEEACFYKEWWFWQRVGIVFGGLVGIVIAFSQTPFFDPVWKWVVGPSAQVEAHHREVYEEAREDLREAIRTGDPSILESRWCGEARQWAEGMVEKGDREPLEAGDIEYGLRLLEPDMTTEEEWVITGTTGMTGTGSYRIKVWFGDGCIIKFFPTFEPPHL